MLKALPQVVGESPHFACMASQRRMTGTPAAAITAPAWWFRFWTQPSLVAEHMYSVVCTKASLAPHAAVRATSAAVICASSAA